MVMVPYNGNLRRRGGTGTVTALEFQVFDMASRILSDKEIPKAPLISGPRRRTARPKLYMGGATIGSRVYMAPHKEPAW